METPSDSDVKRKEFRSSRLLKVTGGRNKIGHLKGENKWKGRPSLDSNELDIEDLKAARRNINYLLQDRNITETYTSDLRVAEAFCKHPR